ncbi:Uma2 family endonuclease [cf. Phormidesmis sp. LEGE 11477]|uniref:Uma2 family endonuclease n=1 Tax=cf. Phormidesmis sp. LEGE 11477 TaxID=1828680 RepID=UPI00187E97BC|nr:Uma2 family endonuclease [cf. Phormidesmis sp. LEGE 11477]MBE9061953.1 Uma2 family endonuclease [cf. Phormidesmis sp. LEGE 11477]
MTFTSVRYKNYEEYLYSDLASEGDLRLLSSGEVIELPPEDEENTYIADEFSELLKRLSADRRLVKSSSIEIQVRPVGDNRVNRKPDIIVLQPEHLKRMAELRKGAILFGAPPPLLVAEIVSPGSERTENYRRDYDWKRQQYEWWQIPEYWIIDRHRQQVAVFILGENIYEGTYYYGSDVIKSTVFPMLRVAASKLLSGNLL